MTSSASKNNHTSDDEIVRDTGQQAANRDKLCYGYFIRDDLISSDPLTGDLS